MRDYHKNAYVNDLKPFELCGKIVGFEGTLSQFVLPYPINETHGEHDYKSCKNCSGSLKKIKEGLHSKYKGDGKKLGFPLCCPYHANLISEVKDFKKEQFDAVPDISANKIIYTYQHILNQKEKENWKNEISDYFDYAIESFGNMPSGCGCPLFLDNFFEIVEELVNLNKDLNNDIISYVLDYINNYKKKESLSVGILAETYTQWINCFPFELSFFTGLKEKYENKLPLSIEPPRKNKYSGKIKGKLISVKELNTLLSQTTNKLIREINSYKLFESGQLTDPEKIKLEVILENRRLKNTKGYLPNKEYQNYEIMLSEWLEDEKQFLAEITPYVELREQQVKAEKSKVIGEKMSQFGFMELEPIKQLSPINQVEIVRLICTSSLPYSIAMLEFLGFPNHLLKNYSRTKKKMHSDLAGCFGAPDRSIKGNLNVLNPKSEENRKRYTAHKFIETVKKDYENLK